MLRNETLLLLPQLIQGNADLQKIVAFSGAFERLLRIIEGEGGVEGGIVVQDAMVGMGGLLRYNASNQVSVRSNKCFAASLCVLTASLSSFRTTFGNCR